MKKDLNLLEMRPVRLLEFEFRNDAEGQRTTVLVPRFGSGKFGKWIAAKIKKPNHKINLDELGTFIWGLCDGNLQVKDIGARLKDKFGDRVEPVYDRVALFLKHMERVKFISFKEISKKELMPTSPRS